MFVCMSRSASKKMDGSGVGVGRQSCRLAKTIQMSVETFGAAQLSSAQLSSGRASEKERTPVREAQETICLSSWVVSSFRFVASCWCCATVVIRAAPGVGSSSRNANELTPFNAPIADVKFRASLIRGGCN